MKWVVNEPGTEAALALRRQHRLLAPDLLMAECANVLWQKWRHREITREQMRLGAGLLQTADVALHTARPLLTEAAVMAADLGHPAYDCIYLALAVARDCVMVTADRRFAQRVRDRGPQWRSRLQLLLG